MSNILDVIKDQTITYEQKVLQLAQAAENTLDVLNVPEETQELFDKNMIDNLFEGDAPYRPRYVMPDYQRYMEQGSAFLDVEPPKNLDEALTALAIIYSHVPSITSFPVYIGDLDKLLDPFLDGYTDVEVKEKLILFLNYLDRTITDSFCHANLGPEDTRAGRLILEVLTELQNAVPNFTWKYDPDITSDEMMELAMLATMNSANPAIVNHKMVDGMYGDEVQYGISSCYNLLPVHGGAYTLSRLVLGHIADESKDVDDFMDYQLPRSMKALADYMSERVRFLVEESGFFESSFLVKENLISPDNFVGMYGVVGLGDCVNTLLKEQGYKYGHDKEADDLAEEILKKITEFVENYEAPYSKVANGRFMLHAQVGMDYDTDVTAGIRIPVGTEPENLADHLRHSARYHKYMPTGASDIFAMESPSRKNPAAMVDIVKGAFKLGCRYISFYEEDGEMVRITGYLVKRSEMEKVLEGKQVLQNTSELGAKKYVAEHLADRKVRGVV